MNRLLTQAGLPKIDYKKQKSKTSNEIVWTENVKHNVDKFNDSARALGVPEMYMVQAPDLINGRKGHMFNIMVAIHKLGLVVRILQ